MERLSFDTSFLIDLQREKNLGPGKAHAFLHQNAGATPVICQVVVGEFSEGFGDPRDHRLLLMIDSFVQLDITRKVAEQYAGLSRRLRETGNRIGANDLWIAACSLVHNLPLVTRNLKDFSRVPGLDVIGYERH